MSQTRTQTKKNNIEAHESHEIFFKTITRRKLNELLNRVSTRYLQNQINQILKGYTAKAKIAENCDGIYINYCNMNGNDIGHISFHLNKNNRLSNNNKRKGMFHIKNNRNQNRYYTIRVNHKKDLYEIKVNSPLKMKQDLEYCVNSTLNILNDYTEPQSIYYLGNRLTKEGDTNNICLINIAGINIRKKFPNTRKQHINKIPISKELSKIHNWKSTTYKKNP